MSLSVSLRERDKEREQHMKEEVIQHFKAFMADMVRNADASWRETRKRLHRDHRWSLAKSLDKTEKERLFEEHVAMLNRKNKELFHRLLDDTPGITLTSTWKEVRKLIRSDPRCARFSSHDRRREKEYTNYQQERLSLAKSNFIDLLKETKLITYKLAKLAKESDQHLKDITLVLQNDKRFLVLDCIAEERHQMLMSYIDEVQRRGPPPPPTASDPSRRMIK